MKIWGIILIGGCMGYATDKQMTVDLEDSFTEGWIYFVMDSTRHDFSVDYHPWARNVWHVPTNDWVSLNDMGVLHLGRTLPAEVILIRNEVNVQPPEAVPGVPINIADMIRVYELYICIGKTCSSQRDSLLESAYYLRKEEESRAFLDKLFRP